MNKKYVINGIIGGIALGIAIFGIIFAFVITRYGLSPKSANLTQQTHAADLSEYPTSNQSQIMPHAKKKSSHRGIYITESTAANTIQFQKLLKSAKQSGINTIVLDAKYTLSPPVLKLLKDHQINDKTVVTPNTWLQNLTNDLHNQGFIVTARLTQFQDDNLANIRPDLAVKSKNGGVYHDTRGGKWADPYSKEVRLYNILIAERAALSGVDEIQFDYIRFPAEGAMKQVYYTFEKPGVTKVQAITSYLGLAHHRLQKYNVSIAVDIFGVTAWQSQIDVTSLGQDIKQMAPYIDVLAPMLYPSHFNKGYDGFANPGSEPYYFINMGTKKAHEILASTNVTIIPWIQGFILKSPNFGPNYISQQIQAAKDAGSSGYLIWNAGNIYDVSFQGVIQSNKPRPRSGYQASGPHTQSNQPPKKD